MTRQPLSLLRLPQLKALVGLSRASIYARLDSNSKYFDPSFPKQISLSPGGRGSVAWVAEEAEAWIKEQIDRSRQENLQS